MTATILPFTGGQPKSELPSSSVAPRPETPPTDPVAQVPALSRAPRTLTAEESALQVRMLCAFFDGYRLAKGHEVKSVRRDRRHVEEFLTYVGQPVWQIRRADFESWAAHLGLNRHLAIRSQRGMQTAVATFWDYLAEEVSWQNEVRKAFDARIIRVVTQSNRIVHTCDETPTLARKYFAATELDDLFLLLEEIVEVASQEAPRQLKVFQRDRAMFYTYYAFGLRLGEGYGLNLHDFSPNPDLPELGQFGCAGVWGKGCRGSGPIYRVVSAVLPDIRPMLEWYLEHIRPKFKPQEDETALLVSERHGRLSKAAIAVRFKVLIAACGCDPRLFSTHVVRHMNASHQACANVPTLFTMQELGHHSAAVTAKYTHLPDDYLRTVAYNYVHSSLNSMRTND